MVAMQRRQVEEPLAARLLRGAVGGVLAGLVFVGVTMWFAHSTGGKPEMPLRMISTIVKGDAAMKATVYVLGARAPEPLTPPSPSPALRKRGRG